MFGYLDLDYFVGRFYQCWWNVLYIVVYIGCLFYIARKKDKVMLQIFVGMFLAALITIFNPLIMEPLLDKIGWKDRYIRFYWILPVGFLCSFFATKLIAEQKKGAERNILLLFLTCFIFLCGGSMSELSADDNIYKVDNSVVAVAEMIENNTDKENPIILCDAEMYYWIRQYDPKLVIPVTNKIMDLYQFQSPDKIDLAEEKKSWKNAVSMFMHGVEIDVDIANKIFEDKEIDFVVCNKEYYSDFYLSYLNLSYVDSVDGYELYRCISN